MQPYKTELARAALQAHRAPLDLRQRRALILCDGQRSLAELAVLLGSDTPMLIAQLQREGYLHGGVEVPATPPPATATLPASGRRRSLVAARLYVLDILALQRHPTALQLHRGLLATRGEDDAVEALQRVLDHLPALTSAGYARRVRERLQEILPGPHLAAVLDTRAPPDQERITPAVG